MKSRHPTKYNENTEKILTKEDHPKFYSASNDFTPDYEPFMKLLAELDCYASGSNNWRTLLAISRLAAAVIVGRIQNSIFCCSKADSYL
ncbi:hypothetical protein T03_2593 [Trichinella britovi]|uniref:Uncharacterized protein n=1 Tax=Trichinella britovi TaxID=45882 RepID=A0A0V1CFQ1_TRIBR|nr:hypothetical protein T03_2593 [Trichinella britovi]